MRELLQGVARAKESLRRAEADAAQRDRDKEVEGKTASAEAIRAVNDDQVNPSRSTLVNLYQITSYGIIEYDA